MNSKRKRFKDMSPVEQLQRKEDLRVFKILDKIAGSNQMEITVPGTTETYQQIANRIGEPKAVRAIGNAVGANPIGVIIPCHRVVRSDGSLGGYRWGEDIKRKLLQRERSFKKD